jgi:hypothetical protein
MESRHQRIHEPRGQLKPEALAEAYPELASKAVSNPLSLADFPQGLAASNSRCNTLPPNG